VGNYRTKIKKQDSGFRGVAQVPPSGPAVLQGGLWQGRSNFRIGDYRGTIGKPGDARSRLLTSALYVAYTCNRPLHD
jgi:hypothetical protein